MADDKKPAEPAKDAKSKDDVGKSGSGKGHFVALGVMALILVGASSAAGAVVAPMLSKTAPHAEKKDAADDEPEVEEIPTVETMTLEAIIVDIRGENGEVHHLKIGLAIELKVKVGEEEMKGFVPRARDAAITYLRSLSPSDVTSNQRYENLRKELGDRLTKAIGKKFVKGILITDFVVQ